MRRCKSKMVTWILIVYIVNFALGAPTAVQKGLQTSAAVDMAESGTATSQKWGDQSDAWSTTDVQLEDPSPTTPSSDFNRLVKITSSESVASNPTATGSDVASTGDSLPPSLPPMPHAEPSDGWFSDDHFPSRAGWSESVNSAGITLSTGHQLMPQPLAGGFPEYHLPPPPHPESVVEGHSTSTNIAGWSENPGSLLSTGHIDVTRPEPIRRPLPDWILDGLSKSRLRRRVSDSRAVSSAQ